MLYRIAWLILRMFLFFLRWEVEGEENLPNEGPVMLAANHISAWDPIIMGCAVHRQVHFMAKEELFRNPFLGWLIGALGTFPVKRGTADITAFRQAISLLQAGKVVGIFPEGTRSKTGELGKSLPGVSMFALKTKAPVVPMAIFGTRNLRGCGRIKVKIGQPISYEELTEGKPIKEALEEASNKIMERIGELLQSINSTSKRG